jgi:hypothetical protein
MQKFQTGKHLFMHGCLMNITRMAFHNEKLGAKFCTEPLVAVEKQLPYLARCDLQTLA